jgi:uncharacterized protein
MKVTGKPTERLSRSARTDGEELPGLGNLTLPDVPGIISLNNEHVLETSLLDDAGLAELLRMAFYARGVDEGKTAFLIALDHQAAYVNPNFSWFAARYNSFVYIDRVIVSAAARGRGLAKELYRDLFAAAMQRGHERVVCEVNSKPPNPASQAFHAAMGFAVVGEATIHGGEKSVCYLEKSLR